MTLRDFFHQLDQAIPGFTEMWWWSYHKFKSHCFSSRQSWYSICNYFCRLTAAWIWIGSMVLPQECMLYFLNRHDEQVLVGLLNRHKGLHSSSVFLLWCTRIVPKKYRLHIQKCTPGRSAVRAVLTAAGWPWVHGLTLVCKKHLKPRIVMFIESTGGKARRLRCDQGSIMS